MARLAAVHRLRAGRGAGRDPRPPAPVPAPRRPAGRCGSPRRARRARVRRAVGHHAVGFSHCREVQRRQSAVRRRPAGRRQSAFRRRSARRRRVRRCPAPAAGDRDHDRYPADRRADGAGVPRCASRGARNARRVPATASRLVTVRSGDCLWSIAQRYLGAGDRYPEIVSLNYGRDMGDGQVFTNPSLIEPGWRLFLPGQPAGGQPASRTRQPAFRQPASRSSHQGPALPAPAPGREDRHGGTRTMPGQNAAQPGASAAAPGFAAAPVIRPATLTSASAGSTADAAARGSGIRSGALAGAVLTSLMRLRRRQRQERRRGRRIALPADQDVLAAEQRLRAAAPRRAAADPPGCAGLPGSRHRRPRGQELPDIVGLHVTPDVLEVLLAAPAADGPPAPYAISPGRQGMCWQLDLPAIRDRAGRHWRSTGLAGARLPPAARPDHRGRYRRRLPAARPGVVAGNRLRRAAGPGRPGRRDHRDRASDRPVERLV